MKQFTAILEGQSRFPIMMEANNLVEACQLLGSIIADPKMVVSVDEAMKVSAEAPKKECCGVGCGVTKNWKPTKSRIHAHEWNVVNSTFIDKFAWVDTNHGYGVLTIAMLDGTEYSYKNIHFTVIDQFWTSPSKGRFYIKFIKSRYESEE
jgi:hypothetical protein